MDPAQQFEKAVSTAFHRIKSLGFAREAVLSIAHLLQRELSCAPRGRYPHSDELELIMRAVIATLKRDQENTPDWDRYILENLRPGVVGLLRALGVPPNMRSGRKRW